LGLLLWHGAFKLTKQKIDDNLINSSIFWPSVGYGPAHCSTTQQINIFCYGVLFSKELLANARGFLFF